MAQIISIAGRVKAPGRYPPETAMYVSDLIRAGGRLEDSTYLGEVELTPFENRGLQLMPDGGNCLGFSSDSAP